MSLHNDLRLIHFAEVEPQRFSDVFRRYQPDFGTLVPDRERARLGQATCLSYRGFELMQAHVLDDIHLQHEMDTDAVTFVMPVSGHMSAQLDGGVYLDGSYPISFRADLCRSIKLNSGRIHTRVTFSRAALNRKLSSMLDWPVGPAVEFDATLFSEASTHAINSAVSGLLQPHVPIHTGWLDAVEGFLVGLFLTYWPHNYWERVHSDKRQALPRQVKTAIDLMQANPLERLSLDDLCKATSTSPRGLQVSFKSFTGRSIRDYRFELRMQKVKEILQAHAGNAAALKDLMPHSSLVNIDRNYKRAFGVGINSLNK